MRGSPANCARSAAVSGPSPATQQRTSAGSSAIASSSTSRPLRGSWRPQKKIVGPGAAAGPAAAEALDLDAVEQHLVRAAEVALGQRTGVGRHGQRRSRRPASQRRLRLATRYAALSPAAWNVPTIGAGCMTSAVMVGPGRERLVQVDDVEVLVAQRPDRAQRADGSGASGAIEPLAAVGRLLPSGVTQSSGGGPSHGASTRASWPSARSDAGQPEHLALDATRDGEAVRADQADAHRATVPTGRPTARLTPAGYHPRPCPTPPSRPLPRRHRRQAPRRPRGRGRGGAAGLRRPRLPEPRRHDGLVRVAGPRHTPHPVLDLDPADLPRPDRDRGRRPATSRS